MKKQDNTELVILPPEVKEIAVKVNPEKQQEVSDILTQIFQGTADWEQQIEAIKVESVADTMAMQMADVARKNVKKARLQATELFDAKRQEVQAQMIDFQTEDKLWLKAKQIMEIKFKAIEDKAKYKAEFLERYAAEQRFSRNQQRLTQCLKYNPDITMAEVENLSDELYNFFVKSLEDAYNARKLADDKARQEQEAKEKADALHKQRVSQIKHLSQFFDLDSYFGNMTDNEFAKTVKSLEKQKAEWDKEQQRIKAENEKLIKEREIQKQKAEAERKAAEEERMKQAEKLRKEREAHEAELREKERERIKLEKELQQRKEAELKEQQEKERLEAERKAQEEAKAKAPVKEQLIVLINELSFVLPENLQNVETAKTIHLTFGKFKKWALGEINKM